MKLKLDENFGNRTQAILQQEGFEVDTVFDEGINGFPDTEIYRKIIADERCLITLDLDFSDTLRFPPEQTEGIIILRPPHPFTLKILENLIFQVAQFIKKGNNPASNLWVVEAGRVRIRQKK